jgi:hypothetical protein
MGKQNKYLTPSHLQPRLHSTNNSYKVNDNTDDHFTLINKSYLTAHALQTNNNYTFSYEYHNLHILVSFSNCSWYEFDMEMLKHVVE